MDREVDLFPVLCVVNWLTNLKVLTLLHYKKLKQLTIYVQTYHTLSSQLAIMN